MEDVIRMLRDFGHSYAKAHEITLDALRGDPVAVDWVRAASINDRPEVTR